MRPVSSFTEKKPVRHRVDRLRMFHERMSRNVEAMRAEAGAHHLTSGDAETDFEMARLRIPGLVLVRVLDREDVFGQQVSDEFLNRHALVHRQRAKLVPEGRRDLNQDGRG